MSYRHYQDKKLNISFRSNYRQAVFGMLHVAFQDNDCCYYFDSDDKESLVSALEFYEDEIRKRPTFPTYDGKGFYPKDSSEPEVLRQILGLPSVVFDKLDLFQDILPQLHFKDDLSSLKKQCLTTLADETGKKWFSDEFRAYCLTHGFFFLYEETKPFVDGRVSILPVFLHPSRFPEHILKLYQEATADRFLIDFTRTSPDPEEVSLFRKLDSFSFMERVSYFINDDFNQEISSINLNVQQKKRYTYFLKMYLVSLINVLYDDFSYEVLNQMTTKLSYLSVSKLVGDKDCFSISSYSGDMFSYDGKTFFFSKKDRPIIKANIEALMKEGSKDILSLYIQLGLPFEGYLSLKHLKDFSLKEILQALPFRSGIDESMSYLCAKRNGYHYSYLPGSGEYKIALMLRILSDYGITMYSEKEFFSSDEDNRYHVFQRYAKRPKELQDIFYGGHFSLEEKILPVYLLFCNLDDDPVLRSMLHDIDDLSSFQSMTMFFRYLNDSTVNQALDYLLYQICYEPKDMASLRLFFKQLIPYLFLILEKEYRNHALHHQDGNALLAVDRIPNEKETYEPNLPYPYVSYGKAFYSFRKTYTSVSYLCESEREALECRYRYFSKLSDSLFPKADSSQKKKYILDHLGLPDDIISESEDKDDILSSIFYQPSLCHLCHKATPGYYLNLGKTDSEDFVHPYLSYLVANGSLHGVFASNLICDDDVMDELTEMERNGTFHTILDCEPNQVEPILKPYLHLTPKETVAFLTSFFCSDAFDGDLLSSLELFADLGEETINRVLFHCRKEDRYLLNAHSDIISRFYYLYRILELAYLLYVNHNPDIQIETDIGFNLDYNQRLPYPYVLLGRVFNAYTDDPIDGEYYFCSCDKEAIRKSIVMFKDVVPDFLSNKDYVTAVVLALSGLPYVVVRRLLNADLALEGVDGVMKRLSFRDDICRRCTGINHCSYHSYFEKSYPFKENRRADYDFVLNGLMHDGLTIIGEDDLRKIIFNPKHHYDLDTLYDPLVPILNVLDKLPLAVYEIWNPDKEHLSSFLYEYAVKNTNNAEAVAYASGVIMDTYTKKKETLYQFACYNQEPMVLRDRILSLFPEVERVRESFLEPVMQAILGFITYLFEKTIQHYVLLENHIGR